MFVKDSIYSQRSCISYVRDLQKRIAQYCLSHHSCVFFTFTY